MKADLIWLNWEGLDRKPEGKSGHHRSRRRRRLIRRLQGYGSSSSSSSVMQWRDGETGCMQMGGGGPWMGTVFGRRLERDNKGETMFK